MARTLEQIVADQDARGVAGPARGRAIAGLARVPSNIAELIERSPMRLTLGLTLNDLFSATRREDITGAGGYFMGVVFTLFHAGICLSWSADDFEALQDYGQLATSTALLQLVE